MGATDKSCENISDLLSIESTEIPKRQLNFVPYIPDIFSYVFSHVLLYMYHVCVPYHPISRTISVRFQENPRIR